ncbi:hypothetical protein GHT06_010229 [Daphnia sinensis]|uniref:Uncharacterized protein n=1 Tax=Daphnia sinensis TaxID=1820382 RepID=A0AAD5KXU6_9CRUS|nr:hypothetical protein GHT06_010229 [Daphnia sinensis]
MWQAFFAAILLVLAILFLDQHSCSCNTMIFLEIMQTIQGKWVRQLGRILSQLTWISTLHTDFFTCFHGGKILWYQLFKILACQTFIEKRTSYNILRPWLGGGLLLASMDRWGKNRRLSTPAFRFEILDNFFYVFNKNADDLCQQLAKAAISNKGQFTKEIDVFPFLKKCTPYIISEAAMGIKISAQLEDSKYLRDVHRISEIVVKRFFSSNFLPDRLKQGVAQGRLEVDVNDEDLGAFKKRRAFLDLILMAVKDGVELSDVDIHHEVDTFMFEGHHTTAAAFVWFLYCMARNPEHQELVRQELDELEMITALLVAILLVLLTVLFLAYRRWECSSFVKTIDLIPGPKKRPIVGNATSLPSESDEIMQTIQGKWVKQFGRIYRSWLGFRTFVHISTPNFVEKILTSQTYIEKGKSYSILTPWLGEGLLLATGIKWKKNRRLLTPAFHFQILDNFFDVFNKNADILCDQLAKALKSECCKEIDVFPFLKKCTLDIICEAAMGIKINAQLEDTEYIRNVHRISEIVVERFFSFGHFLPDWAYRCTPKGREHFKILKQIHDFTSQVIRERKEEIALEEMQNNDEDFGKIKKRRAFLDLMLLAVKDGVELSEMEIRNEVDTFMFEGHDTTASALVWFLYCMGTNPEHQELVREELNEVFGNSASPCTIEDANKLKYLECCIKESLRLYPAVPNITRYISEDFELGGYKIPTGASLSVQIYALHRNEEYFPDPDVFKPERFQVDESIGRHAFAYVPFSAGPRNCIGQRFAMFEEKVLASAILRRFRVSYDFAKHGPSKGNAELVLRPKHGMPLNLVSIS